MERKEKWSTSIRGRLYDLLEAARGRAVKSNLEINIDLEYLLDMFEKQEGKCSLTGLKLTLERNPNGERFYLPYSPSIDRINSNLGYTKENSRIVAVITNLALNKFGDEVFDIMCKSYISKKYNIKYKMTKELAILLEQLSEEKREKIFSLSEEGKKEPLKNYLNEIQESLLKKEIHWLYLYYQLESNYDLNN